MTKREAFFELYDKGHVVQLHLDPRKPYVNVPRGLRQVPHLVLEYGKNMPVPIMDLFVSEEGLEGTLSFNRSPVFTLVPWDAVFAITDPAGYFLTVYPNDVPPEVSLTVPVSSPTQAPRPSLRAVEENEVPEPALTPAPMFDGPPALRLVK